MDFRNNFENENEILKEFWTQKCFKNLFFAKYMLLTHCPKTSILPSTKIFANY